MSDDKDNETHVIRVPRAIADRIRILADRERRTIGGQAEILLVRALAEAERSESQR